MLQNNESIVAAQRALLETAHNVGLKSIEGAAKLFELNLQAVRATIGETTEQFKSLLEADAAARLTDKSLTALPQASGEKLASYTKQAYDIVAATNGEIAELLQKHVEDTQELAVAAFDNAAKNAPAGSESLFAAARTSFGAARSAYTQAVSASKKLTEMAEQNVATVAKAGARVASVKPAVASTASPIVTAAA